MFIIIIIIIIVVLLLLLIIKDYWYDADLGAVALVARRDIAPGEEVIRWNINTVIQ